MSKEQVDFLKSVSGSALKTAATIAISVISYLYVEDRQRQYETNNQILKKVEKVEDKINEVSRKVDQLEIYNAFEKEYRDKQNKK